MELKSTADIDGQEKLAKNSARLMASGGGTGSADFIPHDEDSIERETILGYQLTNPYLINNMMQAYGNLGQDPAKAIVNNFICTLFTFYQSVGRTGLNNGRTRSGTF